jgi:uncharacterized membrane protein YtjA (UPF0391 family)
MFLIVAIVAAIPGVAGVAFAPAGIGKILFFVLLALFIASIVASVARRA